MKKLRKVFDKFDKNGDGKISTDELSHMRCAVDGSKPSQEEVGRIMQEIDKDGDGYIDFDEFAAFHGGGVPAAGDYGTEKELKDAFDLFDVDKNSKISSAELHSVLKKPGEKCSMKDCVKMISQVDKDGDGKISGDELSDILRFLDSEEPLHGASFDTLVRECTKDANGNDSLKEQLMTSHVVKGLVHKRIRDEISAIKEKEERCKRSRQASRIESSNKPVPERCYLGVVEKEGHIVKKPAAKEQSKKMMPYSLKKNRQADSCLEEENGKKKRRTTVKKNNLDKQLGLNPPDLPQEFKDRILSMNGKKLMLVTEKALTRSDKNKHLGRFSMPNGQIRSNEFLTDEEKFKLKLNKRGCGVISCSLIQPCLESITDLEFKKWDMNNIFSCFY